MNDKDLVAKLKAIKAEILALKQAHKYGLGRADFFKGTVSLDISAGVHNIEVQIRYPSLQNGMPFLWVLEDFFQSMSVEQDGINTITITGTTSNFSDPSTISLAVVSTLQYMAILIREV